MFKIYCNRPLEKVKQQTEMAEFQIVEITAKQWQCEFYSFTGVVVQLRKLLGSNFKMFLFKINLPSTLIQSTIKFKSQQQ